MFHEVVADAEAGAERDADEVTAAMLLTSFETLVSEAVDEIVDDILGSGDDPQPVVG